MSALKRFLDHRVNRCCACVLILAAPGEIKLATLVPANTSWHKALLDMGNTWNKDTAGRVTLTVYPGGTQGDESTTIKKMRPGIDTLQASFLTAAGLAELDEAFNVFAMPFFFESDEEEMAVEKKLTPLLEQSLQAKGFHLLSWGTGGWVQVFSKKPLRSLADVKGAKLFTTKGADKWLQWYVANGFHPVALLPADIPAQMKLSTGLIDTAPNPPYLALSLQIFRDAKYMLDLHIAPLTGALIISNTAWNRHQRGRQAEGHRGRAGARETRARRSAGAGRGIGQADDRARTAGHHARSEGRGGVPRRRHPAGVDDARHRWCRPTCSTWRCRSATRSGSPKASSC